MKSKYSICLVLLLVLLASRSAAVAQSRVPAADDYGAFSRFIADRNIFNPDRYPHTSSSHHSTYHPPIGRSAPAFSFVGTMVYDKGMFAFFDGNNDEYRKSLQTSGTIAGYTIQQITLTNVMLAEGSNTFSLAVGSMMQKSRDGTWMQSDHSEDFSTTTDSSGSSPSSTSSTDTTPGDNTAAPTGATPPMSDVLKRLMMLRQQENK